MKAFITLLLSAAGFVACSQTQSFHLIQYIPPVNWSFAENQGAKQYGVYDSISKNYCLITIYGSANSTGNAQTDFQQEWKMKILSIGNVFGSPKIQTLNAGAGLKFAVGAKQVSMKNGSGSYFIRLLVLSMDNYRQTIAFASGNEKMLGTYAAPIQSFLATIEKNTSAGIDNINGNVNNNGNTNSPGQGLKSNNGTLYCGIQAATEGFNYGNSKRYLYLQPDNSFTWGYTQEGYYNFNQQNAKNTTPDFCGVYKKNANKLTLNFYSSRIMEFTINKDGNLVYSQDGYQLTKFPVLNNLRFEGTYTKTDLIPDLWPNGRQPKATLHANGRFEDESLLAIGEFIDPSLPYQEWKQKTAEHGLPGNGSYAIVDNSLLLNYDDGRRKQLLIFIFDKDIKKPSPELIVVAGQSFTLVK
jgi:hypothetical protein